MTLSSEFLQGWFHVRILPCSLFSRICKYDFFPKLKKYMQSAKMLILFKFKAFTVSQFAHLIAKHGKIFTVSEWIENNHLNFLNFSNNYKFSRKNGFINFDLNWTGSINVYQFNLKNRYNCIVPAKFEST